MAWDADAGAGGTQARQSPVGAGEDRGRRPSPIRGTSQTAPTPTPSTALATHASTMPVAPAPAAASGRTNSTLGHADQGLDREEPARPGGLR